MSAANLLYMVLVLGLVFGGFGYCLYLLMTRKDSED